MCNLQKCQNCKILLEIARVAKKMLKYAKQILALTGALGWAQNFRVFLKERFFRMAPLTQLFIYICRALLVKNSRYD